MREFECRRTSARTPSPRRSGAPSPASRAWARYPSCGLTPPCGLRCLLGRGPALLAHLEAFLQARHEIDDVRGLGLLRLLDLDRFALHLGLDDLHQVVVVVVGVLRRIEIARPVP